MAHYAGLCRSTATHEIITRWGTEPERACAQFRTLKADSAVDPLDTALLTWGGLQGMIGQFSWPPAQTHFDRLKETAQI